MHSIGLQMGIIHILHIRGQFQVPIQCGIVYETWARSSWSFRYNSDPEVSLAVPIGMQRTSVLMCVSMRVCWYTGHMGSHAYRYRACPGRYPILLLNSSLNGHPQNSNSVSLEANSHRCSPASMPVSLPMVCTVAHVQQVVASLAYASARSSGVPIVPPMPGSRPRYAPTSRQWSRMTLKARADSRVTSMYRPCGHAYHAYHSGGTRAPYRTVCVQREEQ